MNGCLLASSRASKYPLLTEGIISSTRTLYAGIVDHTDRYFSLFIVITVFGYRYLGALLNNSLLSCPRRGGVPIVKMGIRVIISDRVRLAAGTVYRYPMEIILALNRNKFSRVGGFNKIR